MQGEEVEDIQIGKEEENCPLFAEDMILYMKKMERIQIQIIYKIIRANKFNKVAGYKINI